MKAIIFGINGQDGFYLSRLLEENNVEVIGVSRSEGAWIKGDVANYNFVEELIKTHKPNYVFHLAANSTTSHNVILENHATISGGTLNILENVKNFSPSTKVFLSGSAMQFQNNGLPINEETPFVASSPYSVERIYSTNLACYYRKMFGLQVYVGYFFNHDSPLRTERHINKKIALAVKRIQNGSTEKLIIGNTDVRKEFNFAGDLMNAVWILVNQTNIFEAVIGSGEDYSIADWLEACFKIINKNWKDHTDVLNDYVPEYQRLVSNPAQIKSLGWTPEVSFLELAKMMIS